MWLIKSAYLLITQLLIRHCASWETAQTQSVLIFSLALHCDLRFATSANRIAMDFKHVVYLKLYVLCYKTSNIKKYIKYKKPQLFHTKTCYVRVRVTDFTVTFNWRPYDAWYFTAVICSTGAVVVAKGFCTILHFQEILVLINQSINKSINQSINQSIFICSAQKQWQHCTK